MARGDGCIDVESREVDVRKRLENKGFSKMRCDFLLHQVGEDPCRINEWEYIHLES